MSAQPSLERIGLGLALRRQHAALLPAFHAALDEIVASGAFVMGPHVARLESALAGRAGAPHAIAVHSGTDALLIALRALDIGPGDEVIVPAFTFFATAEAVMLAGATPVIVDVEPATMTMDPAHVISRVTPRTRAIIPVHLYGQCARIEAIREAAPGVAIVEDMAQALDATRGGAPAGSFGAFGAVSFYVTKNLGALGDGGLLFARHEADADRARRLRDHGSSRKYFHEEAGLNSRLDTLQAAFLLAKLDHLDAWTPRRREIARAYDGAFAGLPLALPVEAAGNRHVYHQYAVRAPERDGLKDRLLERGIETGVHYPMGLHRMPALGPHVADPEAFPQTDRAAAEVLCLPIFPEMTDSEVERVIAAVGASC